MLANRGLLVSLTLGLFDPKKRDKTRTKEIADRNGASATMFSVSKRLFPEQAAEAIRNHDAATRSFFMDNTSPFADGLRLLDIRNFDSFMGTQPGSRGLRQMKSERELLVSNYRRQYSEFVEQSRNLLGDTFDGSQYPDADKAVSKFTFELETLPVPESGHLAFTLAGEEMASLRRHFEERESRATETAVIDMIAKLSEPLCRFATRVQFNGAAADGVRALWDDLRSICDRIPRINITDDQRVLALRDALRTEILDKFQVDAVIGDEEIRDDAQAKTRDLLVRIQSELQDDTQAAPSIDQPQPAQPQTQPQNQQPAQPSAREQMAALRERMKGYA